ncbi:MAG: DUF2764 family protein [Spirochaetaceae bacterium]|nr:DUF2764 family protein [Spirochaetaceae bacterium]
MNKEDYAELEQGASLVAAEELPESFRSPLLWKYLQWERTFRNELSVLRARDTGRDENKYSRPCAFNESELQPLMAGARQSAALCFAVQDPLLAEQAIERERWAMVEELSIYSSFDLDFLMAYRLKLGIVSRLARFDQASGMASYGRLYSDILGRAPRTVKIASSGDIA